MRGGRQYSAHVTSATRYSCKPPCQAWARGCLGRVTQLIHGMRQ